MRKQIFLVLTCLLILLCGCLTAGSYASDSDLYKNIDETATESNDDYFANYRDNYQLDTEKMSAFKNMGSVICDLFANTIFAIQVLLAKVTISLFSFSLSSNIAVMLGSFLEPFIIAMKGSIWDSFAVFAIGFAAFLLLIKMMQNRTAQALSSLVALVFIITLAFAFYAYPIQMLEGVDDVTSGVCETVMDGPYKATVGGKAGDAKGKAAGLCWNLFVHQPWQILEFGSVTMAERHEAEILKSDTDSEQRKEEVKKLATSDQLFSKSLGYQVGRLVTAIILLIFTVLLMAILMIFSVLIVGYQFLVLVYLLLGIFVFLVALIPAFGLPLVKRWGGRIISISFIRILVVFFLSITLIFMEVIYKLTDKFGLLTSIFLILVIISSIWFERFRLLNLFSGIQLNASSQLPQSMNKALNQDFNAVDGTRQVWRNLHRVENSDEEKTSDRSSNYSHVQRIMGGRSAGSYLGGSGTLDLSQMSESMSSSTEKMSAAANDMGRYFRQAEELLQRQYEISKEKSEDASERKQENAEYSNFVKRTDAVRKFGAGSFEQRDISSVANILRRTEMQGGNVQDVITNGNSIYWEKQKNVERPSNLGAAKAYQTNVDVKDSSNPKKQAKKQMGVSFFKDNFGEEMGEDCYEAVSKKYGKESVDEYDFSHLITKRSGDPGAKTRKASYAEVLKELETARNKKPQSKNPTATQKMRKNEVSDE